MSEISQLVKENFPDLDKSRLERLGEGAELQVQVQ